MRRILFPIFTLLLPVFLLLAAEGVLRLFIPGTPPPMIRKLGDANGASFMVFDREGPASFFGPAADRMSPAQIVGFQLPKPDNTIRIILTGESAMRGFPQPDAFNAASFLTEMLKDDYPDRNIEVLNFSATAIASFPVMKITEAALAAEPDAIVTLAGHNEFFGAYGVLATRHIGSIPGLFELEYRLRHTAVGRAIGKLVRRKPAHKEPKQLMEMMATEGSVPLADPIRQRALKNLSRFVSRAAASCRDAGIPLVICIPPSNETDLRPIGPDEETGLVDGRTARERYEEAKALHAANRYPEAMPLYADARDRDSMPWRASSVFQKALVSTAQNQQALVCDLDAAFRSEAGDRGIGWNLMDDHVHPNIEGQALMAETIRRSLHQILGPPAAPANRKREDYLRELGDNIYDRFSVAHTMAVLFRIPFLAESNPEAGQRFDRLTRDALSQMPPETAAAVMSWQQTPMLSIGKPPLSALAAMEWLKRDRLDEALPLLRSAIRSVPPYSSWSLEYTYFYLAAARQARTALTADQIALAEAALERGEILARLGASGSGQTERFMGRILQVLGRHEEALPLLRAASERLTGLDRTANNRAIYDALIALGREQEAEAFIRRSLGPSGPTAP